MKKKDQKILLLAAAAAAGVYLYKQKQSPAVAGNFPGIGATMPNHSIVPASMRGKPSPLWLDAAVWGAAGAAVGYYGLAKKKF